MVSPALPDRQTTEAVPQKGLEHPAAGVMFTSHVYAIQSAEEQS